MPPEPATTMPHGFEAGRNGSERANCRLGILDRCEAAGEDDGRRRTAGARPGGTRRVSTPSGRRASRSSGSRTSGRTISSIRLDGTVIKSAALSDTPDRRATAAPERRPVADLGHGHELAAHDRHDRQADRSIGRRASRRRRPHRPTCRERDRLAGADGASRPRGYRVPGRVPAHAARPCCRGRVDERAPRPARTRRGWQDDAGPRPRRRERR